MKNPSMCLALVVATFGLTVLPPILLGVSRTSYWEDQENFHIPQVNYFIGHPFSLLTYAASSAPTPGHHLLLAWFATLSGKKSVDGSVLSIRLINAAFGLAFLILVWVTLRRVSGTIATATALTLPLAGSYYVITASIWIVTDNGALFFYAVVLFVLLFRRGHALLAGASTTLLVLWRQIYLPVVGAFFTPLLLGGRSRRAVLVAVSATVPAVLTVGLFAWTWGGLTPPQFQGDHRFAMNLAVPLHALALTGLLALPYVPFAGSLRARLDRPKLYAVILLAVGIGLVVWLPTESVYDRETGRWGSWVWYLARHSPALGGRAPLVLALVCVGALALLSMAVHSLEHRYFPAELLLLAFYFAGYSTQPFAWQRYIEPHTLLTLGVFCSRLGETRARVLAGPVLLSLGSSAMSLLRVYGVLPGMLG